MPSTTYIALLGPGLVGRAVLAQLAALPQFRVVAVANSSRMVLSSSGITADALKTDVAVPLAYGQLADHVSSYPGAAAIIDCTASDAPAHWYAAWLARGISVVTPNKKAFAGDAARYAAIRSSARAPTGLSTRKDAGLLFHESTVGAGLPLLCTIKDLVATGDVIESVEGVLSGTLSYLFNEYCAPGTKSGFAAIVETAKSLGYTEPDPRDDLNGLDVARKVVILARAAGLASLTLEDVEVENIVPAPLREVASAETFLTQLPQFDAEFAARKAAAAAKGAVLRYVGRVELNTGKATVKVAEAGAGHPLAGLGGADNMVVIKTKRFPRGLVIQGAGAGDAVTAFGVVADALRVHHTHAFEP
ncbi:hypothetical protein GGF32_002873 [Allomyces javanicus]|nr:hypothetical protein GGF32_002873 [Allomyces javanicus]